MLLKNRTLICVCLSIPLLILGSLLRPEETAILPFSYDPMHTTGAVSERFWVMKAQGMSRYDMILMGDSRVYRGLSPQAMEEVLPGERILNFGFSGGGFVDGARGPNRRPAQLPRDLLADTGQPAPGG
jgi:hypothetical protein